MKTISPYTNKTIKEFSLLTKEQLEEKIDKATNIFETFQYESFTRKKGLLLKAAEELKSNKTYYAGFITLEMGKVKKEAISEIEKCAWVCEFYAENAEKILQEKAIESDASESYVSFEPLGVLLTVMPWNFPFWQFFRCAAPALMLGNTLLLKHASNVPQCALAIEEVFKKAGYEEGVMQTLLIDSSQVNQVIEHKGVKAVTLTGSEKAGGAVASEAGKHIKKTVLELGGSDPFIVLPDANLHEAVAQGVKSRFMNCGQSCIAAKRFIIHEDILDDFLSNFKVEVQKLVVGNPEDEETTIGPMARMDLAKDLKNQLDQTVAQGANIFYGGKLLDREGAFFEPTIVMDIPEDSPAYTEEKFGPVASVYSFKTEEEAMAIANATRFGLGASLWTNDIKKAKILATKIKSGGVFINGLVKSDPRLPFGGIKMSGYGRELSEVGLLEFANMKTVWIG